MVLDVLQPKGDAGFAERAAWFRELGDLGFGVYGLGNLGLSQN